MTTTFADLDERGHLCIDRYLQTMSQGVALQAALQHGLIDRLVEDRCTFEQLISIFPGDDDALRFLLGALELGEIVAREGDVYRLTGEFARALAYRDLIDAKLAFASWVASDIGERFTQLLTDPEPFFQQSRLFELFDYGRAAQVSEENIVHTARWVAITSVLTRYEVLACLKRYDLSPHRCMVDIGGNSGEFAFQLCRHYPQLEATVLDLPVVCEVGRRHLGGKPEAARIQFQEAGDGLEPEGYDLVTFKSMLHDWPEPHIIGFIEQAIEALKPGGRLLIYERGPFEALNSDLGYGNLPLMLFFRSYRGPDLYRQIAAQKGLVNIHCYPLQLEMPFFLLVAEKG